MTSKECVKATMAFRPASHVPYGEYAIDSDTAERILGHETYLRAKAKTQIALWEGRRDEVVQSLKEDIVSLYQKLDFIDIINLMSEACGLVPPKDYIPLRPQKIDDSTWEDKTGVVYKYSPVTRDISVVYTPMQWEREYTAEEFESASLPPKPDPSRFEVIDHVVSVFRDERYLIGYAGREAGVVLLGGMERGLTEYLVNPEVVQAKIDSDTRIGNAEDDYFIRDGVDAIMWGQDLAYNSGPFIDPELIRKMALPSIRSRVENVKRHGVAVMKHSCGNTVRLAGIFMDAGYDCYQSIQRQEDQSLSSLRRLYGNRLCLWGGVDVTALISGTAEEVRRQTQEALRLAEQGGIILGSSHSIAIGSKYENVMAMFDEIVRARMAAI